MTTEHPLLRKFFHSFLENGDVHWQGKVVQECGDGFFLVQLFDWISGAESDLKLTNLQNMLGWSFYDLREEMIDAWECRFKYAAKR